MDKEIRELKTIDDVVEYVTGELENANYHDVDFLAYWKSVRPYIVKANRLKACKCLGQAILDSI